MTRTVEPDLNLGRETEQRVLIREVDWEGYQSILRIVGDGHTRLTYDGTELEVKSSSFLIHEELCVLLSRLVSIVTMELDIPCRGMGATTWCDQAANCGLEADESFDFLDIPGKNPTRPDLAIDVEISPGDIDRSNVYARLGVPEVWTFDGKSLTIEQLGDGKTYQTVSNSKFLPMLTPKLVARWVLEGMQYGNHTTWARRFRGWVVAELVPHAS